MFLNRFSLAFKPKPSSIKLMVVLALLAFQIMLAIEPTKVAEARPAPLTLLNANFVSHFDTEDSQTGLIALKLADAAGAEHYAAAVNDSNSPFYHQFLTPAQFMQRFGPDESTVKQVTSYFENQGFKVERDNLLLSLNATPATFEQAFQVQLNTYRANIGGETQEFYSADRTPYINEAIAPYVQSVQLHNRPLRRASMPAPASAQAQVSQPNGLGPSQIRKAYNIQGLLDAGSQGQGQTLGMVQLTSYSQDDIKVYAQQFGISGYKIEDILIPGQSPNSRGAGEAALDIEISIAVAPQITVLVYQAGNSLTGLEQIIAKINSDNRAPVSTSSWGQCEDYFSTGELNTLHALLTQGAAQGLQFLAATGDSGAFDCNNQSNQFPQLSVDYPASDPFAIGIGGTSLRLDANANYQSETVWANVSDKTRSASGAGSGGGLSKLYERPSWQNAPGVQNQYSNGKRQVPDISANADPATGYAIYCTVAPGCSASRPWLRVGGTSASAPLLAAAGTLINQYNKQRVFTAPRLYELASKPQVLPIFRDVTSGNNLFYTAGPGYDFATGLGSVDVFNLARVLAGEPVNPAPTPTPQPTPTQPPTPLPTTQPPVPVPTTQPPVPTNPGNVLAPNPGGFANSAFSNLWNRTDKLVADGGVSRSWLWGQTPLNVRNEPYVGSPSGQRLVQYFDKSRMEINNPDADKNTQYYVSNGLLVQEMISGSIQLGDTNFQNKGPANIGVAGDPDDTTGVTYANLNRYLTAPPNQLNIVLYNTLNRFGDTGQNPYFGQYNVISTTFIRETNHSIAKPFWDYLNGQGPIVGVDNRTVSGPLFNPTFYATGLPVTEPYWTQVKVGGQTKDVLIQAFERRILTYTPSNAPEWRVEMGNVGQHYFKWRYQS